jgi:hypothetical protein
MPRERCRGSRAHLSAVCVCVCVCVLVGCRCVHFTMTRLLLTLPQHVFLADHAHALPDLEVLLVCPSSDTPAPARICNSRVPWLRVNDQGICMQDWVGESCSEDADPEVVGFAMASQSLLARHVAASLPTISVLGEW